MIDAVTATRTPPRTAHPAQHPLDLSIIIVNWNAKALLRDCLRSIVATLDGLNTEIIVVDNASTDGSAETIAQEFRRARLIANDINRGFAAANNQGMRIAQGRYVLLMNPDTVVLDDVIPRALEWAEHHSDVAVLGCQVMDGPSSVQRTCFRFPSPLTLALWASGLGTLFPTARFTDYGAYGKWDRQCEREVDVVSGMFMLVRREAIEAVGLMDEDYFMYTEEADWCHRFRDAGWRCAFAPVGRILHVDGGSKSTDQVATQMYVEKQRSVLLFQKKHRGAGAWLAAKLLFIVGMLLRAAWWSARSISGGGQASRRKAARAAAALLAHLSGTTR